MIRPILDNILVKVEEKKERTISGIILPDSEKKLPESGKVVAIGKTKNIAVGDNVIFKKWSGIETVVDGEKMLLIKEEDILAIVE